MKVRNTHGVELTLTPRDLASAPGHPEAEVREAEASLKDGRFRSVRVHLEYVIATKGIPRTVRRLASPARDEQHPG